MRTADGTPTISLSDLATWRDRCGNLRDMHWRELGQFKDELSMAINWQRYDAIEASGSLLVLIVWAGRGREPIGYSVTFLWEHMRYGDLTMAQNDMVFVHPEWRRFGIGKQLLLRTASESRDAGARRMFWNGKPGTALPIVLSKMGYEETEVVYSKGL